jgi:hypothetical protein
MTGVGRFVDIQLIDESQHFIYIGMSALVVVGIVEIDIPFTPENQFLYV